MIHDKGHLTLVDPHITGSTIQPGLATANTDAGDGLFLGQDIFLMSGGTLTFTISSGSFVLTHPIQSDQGVGGGSGGGLRKMGEGMLDLSTAGTQTYGDSTVVLGGLIRLSQDDNLGPLTNTLILDGGGICPTSTLTSTVRAIQIASSGTIQVDPGDNFTIPTPISGVGGVLRKEGQGTLILAAVNTYSGHTDIAGGTVSVDADNCLGTGPLNFNGGTLEATATFATSKDLSFTEASAISVQAGATVTVHGVVSSDKGSLSKLGSGTLDLAAANTYTMPTVIEEGVVRLSGSGTLGNASDLTIHGGSFEIESGAGTKTIGTLHGTGQVVLHENMLQLTGGTYSGTISGTGGLIKTGDQILTLSSSNTYTGNTILATGTLCIDANDNLGEKGDLIFVGGTLAVTETFAISHPTTITEVGTIDVATGTLTHQGVLSGTGTLNKTGSGTLLLTAASPYTGELMVQQGTVIVDGALLAPVTIDTLGLLSGNGSMGPLQNDGMVIPGASIGTLTINGDYNQSNDGFLVIEIDDVPAISDRLLISGTANLDGSVILNPLPGVYTAGTIYTFIEASEINGQFDQLLENHPLDFLLNYLPNAVQIVIPFTEAVLPVSIDSLDGNAQSIANYLFSCSQIPSPDLVPILRALVKLPPDEFTQGLLQLGPQQFGGLALTRLQTSARIGQSLNRTKNFYDHNALTPCYRTCKDPSSSYHHMVWVNPIGYYYKQNEREDQTPFHNSTYGVTTGFGHLFSQCFTVSAGMGYTHSNLNWSQNRGNAHIQSIYLGPSIGYLGERGYIGLSLVGARSFYKVNRKIAFSTVNEKAKNHHTSWDCLGEISGGVKLKFPNAFQKNLFLIPTVTVDYLNVFENGYQEYGAGSIDLSVDHNHSAFLRSEVVVKILKEMKAKMTCISPNLYIGWLRNIPLTHGRYLARFYQQELCQDHFTVQSYHRSTDQLILGAELILAYQASFSLNLGYEATVGNHNNIQEGNLNFNWRF